MNQTQFELLCKQIHSRTTQLLIDKGREYAGDEDRLANFKRGAALTGVEPLTCLFIYMSKHYDAVASYVKAVQAGEVPQLSEPISGRLDDLINYCVLAQALIAEAGQPKDKEERPPFGAIVRLRLQNSTTEPVISGEEAEKFHAARAQWRASGMYTYFVWGGATVLEWRFEAEKQWMPV